LINYNEKLKDGLHLARITAEHKSQYLTSLPEGEEIPAQLSGHYRYVEAEELGFPTVGDYVGIQRVDESLALIQQLLPRTTLFYRMDDFTSTKQPMAANFDTLFLCMALNQDYNIRRLQRYLIMAEESKAEYVVVLTKADLSETAEEQQRECEAVTKAPVYAVSTVTGEGLETLRPYLGEDMTIVAVGSSGVGKSTLVNTLAGEELMKTSAVREYDGKGRHTTVHRQLFRLPTGAYYLDTPGVRSVGLVEAGEAISDLYSDIEALQKQCRFSDCTHTNEPGCAIRRAIQEGIISSGDIKQFEKLKREALRIENKYEYHKAMAKKFGKGRKHNKGPVY